MADSSDSAIERSGGDQPQQWGGPRQAWLGLGLVLVGFVVLSSTIAIKAPAWESADEPDHVQNIESIVSGHWYGINTQCRSERTIKPSCANDEVQQAPAYYLAMAAWQKVIGLSSRPPSIERLNVNALSSPEEMYFNHSASDHRFLLWLRFPNIALGAATVLLVFLAIRRVSSDPWTPVVAAAAIAFLPRFVFLSAFVTNDNLANLLGAALGYLALRFLLSPSGWNMAWVGATFGLLVATKLSALSMGLVILVLALLVPTWKRRLWLLGVAGGAAVLTCGWYLIQNAVRYGDPLARTATTRYLAANGGLGTFNGQPIKITDPLGFVFVHVPRVLIGSLWYQSGWNQFYWPLSLDVGITAAVLIVLVGIIGRKIRRDVLVTLTTISIAALLSVWVLATQTNSAQGRYALAGSVGFAGLIAVALERWRLPVRFLLPTAGLVGTCVAIQFDVLSVHWT